MPRNWNLYTFFVVVSGKCGNAVRQCVRGSALAMFDILPGDPKGVTRYRQRSMERPSCRLGGRPEFARSGWKRSDMVSNVAVTREVTAAHRLFILVRAQGSLPILHVGGNVMFTDG